MYSVHQPISNDVETEVLHVEAGSVSRPEVYGGLGVVSSTHPLASAAGMRILQNGGNAFDAAAAAAFVLHVVEPEYNGLGGEMVALVKTAGAGRARVLCGQGVAPGRATAELFAGLGHAQIPAVGLLSATVPGAFGAWLLLLRDVGTASIRTILEPAVRIATSGIVVSRLLAKKIKLVKARLCEEGWNAACEVYLPNGDLPREGATLQNLPLAATLANIIAVAENAGGKRELQIEAARRHFYDGAMADAIARFVSSRDLSSDVLETGGLVSNDDLSDWQAGWEDSVHTAYRDWEVYKPSVWSQGPLFLENLNLFDGGRSRRGEADRSRVVAPLGRDRQALLRGSGRVFRRRSRRGRFAEKIAVGRLRRRQVCRNHGCRGTSGAAGTAGNDGWIWRSSDRSRAAALAGGDGIRYLPHLRCRPAWQRHLGDAERRLVSGFSGYSRPRILA